MSTFVPLNLTEDSNVSKKDLEEEHTRELQIEQAYKTFQEALDNHRKGRFKDAYGSYEDLFKLDIINNHYYEEQDFIRGLQNGGSNSLIDELNYLPPNVKTLRYLIFRNRGLLYYDILRSARGVDDLLALSETESEHENPKTMKIKELFYSMMEDLCACLIYQEADEELLKVLYKIFLYLDVKRLAKFTLEYALTGKSESDDIYSYIPVSKEIFRSYSQIQALIKIKDSDAAMEEEWTQEIKKLKHEFTFLEVIKEDFDSQLKANRHLHKAEIDLNSNSDLNWEHVIECINNHTKQLQDKSKLQDNMKARNQTLDPYILTEYPMESVYFKIQAHVIQETDNGREVIEEIKDPQKDQEQETVESTAQEFKEVVSNTQNSELNEESEDDFVSARASPVAQRSSKRFKRNDSTALADFVNYEVSRADFLESERFFASLNSFLEKLDEKEIQVRLADSVEYYLPGKALKNQQFADYVKDFVNILNGFKQTYQKALMSNNSDNNASSSVIKSADDEKLRLLNVLNNFGSQKEPLDLNSTSNIPKLIDIESPQKVEEVLKLYNTDSHHYETLKILIMRHLLGVHSIEGNRVCYITETFWTASLLNKVRTWVLQSDSFILDSMNINEYLTKDINTLSLGISVLELLVDHSITLKKNLNKITRNGSKKGVSKSNKATSNSIAIELFKVNDKIDRWIESLTIPISNLSMENKEMCKLKIRYKWCIIYKEKAQKVNWSESTHIIASLKEVLGYVIECDENLQIRMLNYENIDEISSSSIKSQLMATSVLSMFSKILYAESNENNSEAIQLLQGILIDTNLKEITDSTKSSESVNHAEVFSSIREFLDVSAIDMKLSLWHILFSYYENSNQHSKFQFGFENMLRFYVSYLTGSRYAELPEEQRLISLLKIIGSYDEIMKSYLKTLKISRWDLSENSDWHNTKETLKGLSGMFSLLYTFSIHEEASLLSSMKISVNHTSPKAYAKFKDIFIRTLVLFSIYYSHSLKLKLEMSNSGLLSFEDTIPELLRFIHEQLGLRRLCDSADGLFLTYTQDTITKFPAPSQKDLSQIVSCRYHYHLSCGDFTPTNHETEIDNKLDITTAKELSEFALPLCFSSNPLINIPKHDMKSLIDEVYEVIGDPNFEDSEVLTRNEAFLEYHLDSTPLSAKYLKDAFHGLLNVTFEESDLEMNHKSVIKNGLYYLEGLLIFSSYKVRKKNMQSRAVELDNIIKLLKYDLIFGSNRIECWLLLGQAYGFSVEDDLIWTSDKLTIPERKTSTANLQRKALMCYLMAINESAKQRSRLSKPLIGIIMSSFAKEMYGACMDPMGMHCFKVLTNPRFVKRSVGATFIQVSELDPLMKPMCLKLIQSSLILAVKAKPHSWTMFYYLAKVQKKMKKKAEVVLETISKAIKLAKNHSSANDPLIEPSYILCTTLYKFVKDDTLSSSCAISYLVKFNLIPKEVESQNVNDKKEVYQMIVDSLRKVISMDKKKWHHKPRYRLSRILFDEFGDIDSAISEMSSFVSLKTTSKTLVSIWKPENERPGKHFFYTYQYARFYIELLSKNLDLINLIQMLPKLRRSNAIMISLYSIWEYLCSSICKIIRTSLNINESFVETFMQSLTYQKFMSNSKNMTESMKAQVIPDVLEVHYCFLYILNDMKKLNNGFGPTSLIDDTIVAIFIKIYIHFSQSFETTEESVGTDSPGGRTKKLAKRDFFPFTLDILKIYKKEIDNLQKDKPNLFNEFVKDVSISKNGLSEATQGSSVTATSQANQSEASDSIHQKTPEINENTTEAEKDRSTETHNNPDPHTPVKIDSKMITGIEADVKNNSDGLKAPSSIENPISGNGTEILPKDSENNSQATEHSDENQGLHTKREISDTNETSELKRSKKSDE